MSSLTRASLREAIVNVAWKALPAPVEKASRLLVVVVAAPVFGASRFGTYQFATTVAALLTTATELGLGTWTTRAIARDADQADVIFAQGLRFRLRTVVPYAVVLVLVAFAAGAGEARSAILVLGVAAFLGSLVDYFGAVLRGSEDFRREAATNVSRAILTTGGALSGLWATHTLLGFASGLLLGSFASVGVAGIMVGRVRSTLQKRGAEGARHTGVAFRDLLPLWLAGLLSMLYFRCDIVLLRLYADPAEVGYYAAAYRVFEAAMLAPSVIMSVAFPRLARAPSKTNGWTGLEARLGILLTGLGFLATALLLLLADRIVPFAFGVTFGRSVASLRVLALSLPFLFANFGLTFFLFARGLERRYLALVGVMCVLNVGANLVAIPRAGGPGAGWATLLTEVLLAAGSLLMLQPARSVGRARSERP